MSVLDVGWDVVLPNKRGTKTMECVLLVLELAQWGILYDLIAEIGPFPERLAYTYFMQLASGVCVCIYVCMCVCVCLALACVCVSAFTCTCACVCLYDIVVHVHAYVCVCVCDARSAGCLSCGGSVSP
ncbi:MAG: hypothetical protein P4L40_05095 [Terracidiphilus sp.]|nr:hypothetical protein [Terracidiphilus sp.]